MPVQPVVTSACGYRCLNGGIPPANGGYVEGTADDTEQKENYIVLQLKLQLAEAINLQDGDLIAQLHETIRCVHQFDNHESVDTITTSTILRLSGAHSVGG